MAAVRKYPEGSMAVFNARVRKETRAHIQAIAADLGLTQSELLEAAIDHLVDERARLGYDPKALVKKRKVSRSEAC
ncbi:Ribbon-helix-helix protein, copG family [compost metagenome]